MSTFTMKQGDRLPLLRAVLTDSEGEPLAVSPGDTVTFSMRLKRGGAMKVDEGAATFVTDPALPGATIAQYAWAAGDSDDDGTFEGEFVVTRAGLEQTVPSSGYVLIVIEPRLS